MIGRKTVAYREGDWFAVPLPGSGFGLGLINRAGPAEGVLAGYFFGPRRNSLAGLSEVAGLTPGDAVLAARFGDMNLVNGLWPIIGRHSAWRREDWPMPSFARTNELERSSWRVEYPPDDPSARPRETPIDHVEASRLPRDGSLGSAALERLLDHLLAKGSSVGAPH